MPNSLTETHVGIIGGGFAGLTAALRLAQAGCSVTLWKKGRLGGQAATFEVAGTRLEIFYHHLFKSDAAITALANEIGVGDSLMWLPSNVGYFSDDRIYPLNGALDLLRLGSIPFIDRIRLGLVTAWLQRVRDWKTYETITAHEWLLRALGQRAYDRTLGAQLRAKFGRYSEQIPMVWVWGKIRLRTTSRRSPLEKEKLGYFDGSFQVIVDALVAACERTGVQIVRSGTTGLEPLSEDRWAIFEEGRLEPVEVDVALATTPSHIFQRIAPPLPEDYRQRLDALAYEAAVVVILELTQPLSDIYWLNIADDTMPFTGVIEHTNFVSPTHYQGKRFVYLSKYLEPDHPYYALSDEELLAEYLPHLRRINPQFDPSWVTSSWVFRERAAQPIIPLRYSERIPDLRTPLPRLYLANTTQIYPEDRGTNYSVRLGEDVARLIIDDLRSASAP